MDRQKGLGRVCRRAVADYRTSLTPLTLPFSCCASISAMVRPPLRRAVGYRVSCCVLVGRSAERGCAGARATTRGVVWSTLPISGRCSRSRWRREGGGRREIAAVLRAGLLHCFPFLTTS
eukprot:scaffold14849_cov60-Phaeocystis_antarctica.AAC.1